jgi:hypothetical protein
MSSGSVDLQFISTYHAKVSDIANNIGSELSAQTTIPHVKVGRFLRLVEFKVLEDWTPFTQNKQLKALANKIAHMIHTGKADSVRPMLEKIVTGRIKTLYRPVYRGNSRVIVGWNSLGKGSFRWDSSAISLNQKEIQVIKDYFEL